MAKSIYVVVTNSDHNLHESIFHSSHEGCGECEDVATGLFGQVKDVKLTTIGKDNMIVVTGSERTAAALHTDNLNKL